MMNVSTIAASDLQQFAHNIRKNMLRMTRHAGANGGHLGGSLSCAEILAVLFGHILHGDPTNPKLPERDRFILSKGHASMAYYAALCEAGYFCQDDLMTFEDAESCFPTHAVMNLDKGIELSSGSLGWGLSFGLGCSIAAKRKNLHYRTYVLIGDGECNEGSVWEAFIAAPQLGADNLTAIIDVNGQQLDGFTTDVMPVRNIAQALDAFSWQTFVVDGHDIDSLMSVLSAHETGKPVAVIAQTFKGRGVSFMENTVGWHHARLSEEQYQAAMAELEASE